MMGPVEERSLSNVATVRSEPVFTTLTGEVPFWDHPALMGHKLLPDKYYPYTTLESVLEYMNRGLLDEDDFTLLKVLGDAVCANEDQLRRYMSRFLSRSQVSKKLNRLRRNAFVERWKVRIHGDESYKPPAPFTLGVAGYRLIKHFYNADFFMDPNLWDKYGIGGIKRYVAMNELRCQMTELRIAKKWKWNAVLAQNPNIRFPMAAAEIESANGKRFNLLIDRAQMNQDFIGYFRTKLYQWRQLCEELGTKNIPVDDFPDNDTIVIIYTSTLSMAQFIHEKLMLDTYPFNIMLIVEEHLYEQKEDEPEYVPLPNAFYLPRGNKLERVNLKFK